MENKTNLLIGLNVAIVLWLGVLTYQVMGGGRIDTTAAREAINGGAAAGAVSPIKPLDASTQPAMPTVEVDPATAAAIQFEESTFDFGTIKEGEKVTHVFKFKNTSDKPLTISNAQASCGCTVPQYPKEPVAPGKTGEINVVFDSNGKVGKQSKQVTITANTIPANTVINIAGEVIGKDASGKTGK